MLEKVTHLTPNSQENLGSLSGQSGTSETIGLGSMSANDRQVSGNHYRLHGSDYQHWDMVNEFGLNYFEGNITKYVMRHRAKNGIDDLEKARHYLDKYIEILKKEQSANKTNQDIYAEVAETLKKVEAEKIKYDHTASFPENFVGLSPLLDSMVVEPGQIRPTGWWNFIYEGGSRDGPDGKEIEFFRCRECKEHFKCPINVNPYNVHTECTKPRVMDFGRPTDLPWVMSDPSLDKPATAGAEPESNGYVNQDGGFRV